MKDFLLKDCTSYTTNLGKTKIRPLPERDAVLFIYNVEIGFRKELRDRLRFIGLLPF